MGIILVGKIHLDAVCYDVVVSIRENIHPILLLDLSLNISDLDYLFLYRIDNLYVFIKVGIRKEIMSHFELKEV